MFSPQIIQMMGNVAIRFLKIVGIIVLLIITFYLTFIPCASCRLEREYQKQLIELERSK